METKIHGSINIGIGYPHIWSASELLWKSSGTGSRVGHGFLNVYIR